MKDRMEKYIEFRHKGIAPGKKTIRWEIWNKYHKTFIGEVKWYGAWRKYAFYTFQPSIFEPECLRFIADFCEEATKSHRSRNV